MIARGLAALARMLAVFGALALVGYLGFCGLLYLSQRSYLYFPTLQRAGHDTAAVTFERDGARLVVSFAAGTSGAPVLYFGGNAEDVSTTVPDLVAAFPGRPIYALHYRGYGGSSGHPSEVDLIADALALYDRVHASKPGAVTVIGRSLGSGVAVQLAAARPVDRLVLVTPYDSIAAIARRQFPYMPIDWLLQDRYDSIAYAPRIRTPTTLLVAADDRIIPPANSRRLLAAFAPGVATLQLFTGVGHNDIDAAPGYDAALSGPGTP